MTTEEQRKKNTTRWMEWYRNKGGRDKVLAKRKSRHWMTKHEWDKIMQS